MLFCCITDCCGINVCDVTHVVVLMYFCCCCVDFGCAGLVRQVAVIIPRIFCEQFLSHSCLKNYLVFSFLFLQVSFFSCCIFFGVFIHVACNFERQQFEVVYFVQCLFSPSFWSIVGEVWVNAFPIVYACSDCVVHSRRHMTHPYFVEFSTVWPACHGHRFESCRPSVPEIGAFCSVREVWCCYPVHAL